LFPESGNWSVPWTVADLGVIIFGYMVILLLVGQLLQQTGFYRLLYGADFPAMTVGDDPPGPEQTQAGNIRQLWVSLLSFGFVIGWIVFIQRSVSKATWAQIGFNKERWRSDVVVGYLGWAMITPIVFAVSIFANLMILWMFGVEPVKHPLTQMGGLAGIPEWIMVGFQVVLLAPVIEEWLCRGALMPLISPQASRAHATYAIVGILALAFSFTGLLDSIRQQDGSKILSNIREVGFVLALLPLYMVLCRMIRDDRIWMGLDAPQWRAVFVSSMLFGVLHYVVWPTPIPLFVLGLGLGYVAMRTRSLLIPIIMHALFNAVSGVYLLLGGTP
jgi:membrane protease YdiL (CAAX protease family)